MRLSIIKKAGTEGATTLINIVNWINTSTNVEGAKFDVLLLDARSVLEKIETWSFANMTDTEANTYFFGGIGDAQASSAARKIIQGYEVMVNYLQNKAAQLPASDI